MFGFFCPHITFFSFNFCPVMEATLSLLHFASYMLLQETPLIIFIYLTHIINELYDLGACIMQEFTQ